MILHTGGVIYAEYIQCCTLLQTCSSNATTTKENLLRNSTRKVFYDNFNINYSFHIIVSSLNPENNTEQHLQIFSVSVFYFLCITLVDLSVVPSSTCASFLESFVNLNSVCCIRLNINRVSSVYCMS